MNATVRSMRPTRKELIRWELFCIPAEMAGVAVGLYLGLGLGNWDAAGFIWFAVLCMSGAARFYHYIGAARPINPPATSAIVR
jgi:hypothetical protein